MFKPFKAPSNNHQGFGQGDGAEHVTVKEFVDGVNEALKRLFGMGGSEPIIDAGGGLSVAVLAEAVDAAHGRINDLEEAMTMLQRQFDELLASITAPSEPQPQPPTHPHPDDVKASFDLDGNPASGLAPEPSTHAAPLEADPAGAPKVEPV